MAKVSALDVAKYILVKQGTSMATMKLQKLVHYSQAWHVTWTGKPLFNDEIQAWANGPVTRNLSLTTTRVCIRSPPRSWPLARSTV